MYIFIIIHDKFSLYHGDKSSSLKINYSCKDGKFKEKHHVKAPSSERAFVSRRGLGGALRSCMIAGVPSWPHLGSLTHSGGKCRIYRTSVTEHMQVPPRGALLLGLECWTWAHIFPPPVGVKREHLHVGLRTKKTQLFYCEDASTIFIPNSCFPDRIRGSSNLRFQL